MISLFLAMLIQDKAVQPALIQALNKGDLAVARNLLHKGASPNVREIVTSKPSLADGDSGGKASAGRTALDIAVDRESVPFLKLLLGAKADPNVRSEYGWTPLMSACQRRNVAIVKLLLAAGAKPNLLNIHGDSAIIFASNMDDIASVEALHKAGADLKGGTGQGALICAIQSSAEKTVKYLLSHGVDPNGHAPGYQPPLEYARSEYSGYEAIEKMLIKAGAKGRTKQQLKVYYAQVTKQYEQARLKEEKAKAAKNEAFAVFTPEDREVIEACLVNILDNKAKDDGPGGDEGVNVLLREVISGPASEYAEGQMNGELDERQANDIDVEMRKDFMRRNVKDLSVRGVKFTDPRILVIKDDLVKSARFGGFAVLKEKSAKCWVSVELPGYSADHSRAFLRFGFGPTSHGAAGTMFLRKKDGVWKVVWRDFAFYA